MAKRNKRGVSRQPRHKKSQPSRHDRRERLDRVNPERRRTKGANVRLVGGLAAAGGKMAGGRRVLLRSQLGRIGLGGEACELGHDRPADSLAAAVRWRWLDPVLLHRRQCQRDRHSGNRRRALEETLHDTKEVWGAGQQQVRNLRSNVGCWYLNFGIVDGGINLETGGVSPLSAR